MREFLLIIEGLLVFLMVEMGILFLRKYIREKKTSRNNMTLAWGIFLFSYAAVFVFYIFADFYVVGAVFREDLLNISYPIAVFGAALFCYYTEQEINIRRHYFFLLLSILTGLLIVNAFIQFIESSVYLTFVSWLVFIGLIGFYIKYFTSKLGDRWKLNVYSLIIGVVLVVLGFGGISDWIVSALGLWARAMGDSLIIVGMVLVSLLFIGVPSLAEFEWYKKLRYLNMMHHTGVSVAHYEFNTEGQTDTETMDELLIAGGLTSISTIVSDIVKSEKKLDYVDHGDLKILFDYGKYIINVLITDERLEILRSKLRRFTQQVEFIYGENLAKWDGSLDQYRFIDTLANAIFVERKEI
jgi:hypothetical protein